MTDTRVTFTPDGFFNNTVSKLRAQISDRPWRHGCKSNLPGCDPEIGKIWKVMLNEESLIILRENNSVEFYRRGF
jgi:hypothetical protein